jgi:hypothetical protein
MNDEACGQEMPKYQCHKKVHAVKIIGVLNSPPDVVTDGGSWDLEIDGGGFVRVPHSWFLKHNPRSGGYYVVYDDGYSSFSPAEAFEAGYTLIE